MYTDHHVRKLLSLFSNKWTLDVFMVFDGLEDKIRYTEIHKRIPGISDKMLNQTLGLLYDNKVIRFTPVRNVYPHMSWYWLDDNGREIMSHLKSMIAWDEKNKEDKS